MDVALAPWWAPPHGRLVCRRGACLEGGGPTRRDPRPTGRRRLPLHLSVTSRFRAGQAGRLQEHIRDFAVGGPELREDDWLGRALSRPAQHHLDALRT